jgi:trans-aconitate 2-methyltransferase
VPGGWLVAQCGGAGNLDRLHARAEALMRSPRFARWFTAWTPPWEFADAGTTASRLEAAGFDEIDTWLEDSPVTLEDAERFGDFLTTVILRDHLRYLPGAEERRAFVAELTRQAGSDEPPFLLDYVRLNIRARMARMRNG